MCFKQIWVIATFVVSFVLCSCAAQETKTVELENFESVEVQQRKNTWCWAACAEMVLRYSGQSAVQEDIADRIHGDGASETRVKAASRYEIYRALSPGSPATHVDAILGIVTRSAENVIGDIETEEANWKLKGDVDGEVNAHTLAKGIQTFWYPGKRVPVDELLAKEPAVAGLRDSPDATMGHVYVIIGASYRERAGAAWYDKTWAWIVGLFSSEVEEQTDIDSEDVELASDVAGELAPSKYEVDSVTLIDPWRVDLEETDVDEMRVTMTIEEFESRVDFVATREAARKALEFWMDAISFDVE